MDKYIYDDKNGLWYELQGDYYIPCLILPAEKEQPIGLWGQRHLRYLKDVSAFVLNIDQLSIYNLFCTRSDVINSLCPFQSVFRL